MRGRDIIRVLLLAVILGAGVYSASALAAKPPAPPGSPGDDCSHGNSNQPCKPDPSTNGKDCEDHGNAKGNEDHCDTTTGGSTSTTTTTTTTSSTTPQTSSTPTGSSPSPGGSSSTPAVPEPTSSNSETTPPPTEPAGGASSKVVTVPRAKRHAAIGAHAELPYTGISLRYIAALAALAVIAGLIMRMKTRARKARA